MIYKLLFLSTIFIFWCGRAFAECPQEDFQISDPKNVDLADFVKCVNYLKNNQYQKTTSGDVDTIVKKVTFSSGNGPNVNTNQGFVDGRELRFNKLSDETNTRIFYSDNMRVLGNHKACRWRVTIDGKDCDTRLSTDRHDANSSNVHSSSSIVGYCENLKSGWHLVQVWVSSVPRDNGAFIDSDCYTGWENSVWTLEATELVTSNEK